uniref:Uncharacterized protein n=1 Tax=Clastoptera arizonana TaxID=38151 RepID=A0A1B6D8Z6_9HEMI
MQLTCKCLNVKIESKESSFFNAGNPIEDRYKNDYFFKEDIVCMELLSVHKEQPVLVTSYSLGSWLVHQCLSCHMYTHALNSSNKSTVLVNKNLVSKPEEIAKLKSSERYSQVFRILVNASKDFSILRPLVKQSSLQSAALHEQLTDWIQQETNLTEATVRAFTDEQFASLEARRIRAHADYRSVIQLLSEASQVPPPTYVEMKNSDQKPLPFPESAALPPKKILPMSNKSRVGRKASIDAVGLFTLEGMEERFQSDEELSDTDAPTRSFGYCCKYQSIGKECTWRYSFW